MKDRIVQAYINGKWWKTLIVPNRLITIAEIVSGHIVEGEIKQFPNGSFKVNFQRPKSKATRYTNYEFPRKGVEK